MRQVKGAQIVKICRAVLAGPRDIDGMCRERCTNPLFYESVAEICNPQNWVYLTCDRDAAERFKAAVGTRRWEFAARGPILSADLPDRTGMQELASETE